MTLWIKQGGVWQPTAPSIQSTAGAPRPPIAAWVKDTGAWKQFFAVASPAPAPVPSPSPPPPAPTPPAPPPASATITSPFTAWNIFNDTVLTGRASSTSFSINSDGTVRGSPNPSGTNGSATWASGPLSYYVKFTVTSGSLTANTAPGFTSVASNPGVGVSAGTNGSKQATFTIDIATDAAGTNIVLHSTGNSIYTGHSV